MPKIIDAPGLVWKPRKGGVEARWQARTDLVKRGYTPKSKRVWSGTEAELTPTVAAIIQDACHSLQSEMLVWGRGGIQFDPGPFDGTVHGLICSYMSDPDSGFRKLRFHSRKYYNTLCRRIDIDQGDKLISELKARQIKHWHETFTDKGQVAMGHGVMTMFRTLLSFGMTMLEDDDCTKLSVSLSKMRFTMSKPRNERLTAEQVIAIRAEAHRRGLPSMALAQALQFECIMRQKDIIGEWVPKDEHGPPSDILAEGHRWIRGLRWQEIDRESILTHVTSKKQKEVTIDLKNSPMVLEEFRLLGELPSNGPVVVHEKTGLPYKPDSFRHLWRKIATAVGVPKTVRNMDSRAGAISEATDAGAELEHVRHAATHSDIGMTQRYSRGGTEKIVNVQLARNAHRNKRGTS